MIFSEKETIKMSDRCMELATSGDLEGALDINQQLYESDYIKLGVWRQVKMNYEAIKDKFIAEFGIDGYQESVARANAMIETFSKNLETLLKIGNQLQLAKHGK